MRVQKKSLFPDGNIECLLVRSCMERKNVVIVLL